MKLTQMCLPGFEPGGKVFPPVAQVERAKENSARKTAKKPEQKSDLWRGFVACELTESDRLRLKSWRVDNEERVWDRFYTLVDDGYKLSLSYDSHGNAYVASMTGKATGTGNDGLTLSGRGGTLHNAVSSLVFKHEILLERDWSGAGMQTQREADPDYVG